MPTQWVPPEVYLTHGGVTVYRVYRHDDIEQGPRDYWYGWHEGCSDEEDALDIRDLPNPHRHDCDTDDGRRAVLCEAIDAGVLTPDGLRPSDSPIPSVMACLPAAAWAVLEETLRKDSESLAFDPALRDDIRQALSSVRLARAPYDLLQAARNVLDWGEQLGGWNAPCWHHLRDAVQSVASQAGSTDPWDVLCEIFHVLYHVRRPGGDVYDPDKPWDADTLDAIAALVRPLLPHLLPDRKEDTGA